jgi:hypothetical protein
MRGSMGVHSDYMTFALCLQEWCVGSLRSAENWLTDRAAELVAHSHRDSYEDPPWMWPVFTSIHKGHL